MVVEYDVWGDTDRTGSIQSQEAANFLIVDFNCLAERLKEGRARLLLEEFLNAHRLESGNKLWLGKLHSDRMEIIATIKVIKYWNGAQFARFEMCETTDKALSSLLSRGLLSAGVCSRWSPGPFNLSYSVILTVFIQPRKTVVLQTRTWNMQGPVQEYYVSNPELVCSHSYGTAWWAICVCCSTHNLGTSEFFFSSFSSPPFLSGLFNMNFSGWGQHSENT